MPMAAIQQQKKRVRDGAASSSAPPAPAVRSDAWYSWVLATAKLSAASKKSYRQSLGRLSDVTGGRGWGWVLAHPDASLTALEVALTSQDGVGGAARANPATLVAHCAAVGALYKHMAAAGAQLTAGETAARTTWAARATALRLPLQEKEVNNEASERQLAKHVAWDEWVRVQAEVHAKEALSQKDLVLSVLVLLAPLRTSTLGSLRLYERAPRDRRTRDEENYIVLHKREGSVTLNKYKTAEAYRRMEEEARRRGVTPTVTVRRHAALPPALFQILRASYERQPREWLFVNAEGAPYEASAFQKMTTYKLSEAVGRDPKASDAATVTSLRHSIATWLDEPVRRYDGRLRERLAYLMCHGVTRQRAYAFAGVGGDGGGGGGVVEVVGGGGGGGSSDQGEE